MEQHTLATLIALAFLAFTVFRPGWRSPAMLVDGQPPGRWPGTPGDEDEEQPETDRTPKPKLRTRLQPALLPGAVLVTAGVRVAVLLAMHA